MESSWESMNLDNRIIKAINYLSLDDPTPIQLQSIPLALSKNDIIGIAPTGSGKTYAYLFPVIHWVLNAKVIHNDPTVLILLPTRELAKQVYEVIQDVIRFTEVFTLLIDSGSKNQKYKRKLNTTLDIIISTPGKLLALCESQEINLSNVSILVLDEADRLFDLGFSQDIDKLVEYLPFKNKRQTMFFGATFPKSVEYLARKIQRNPVLIDVGRSAIPNRISHYVYETKDSERFDSLIQILEDPLIETALIFTKSINSCRITTRNLLKSGLDVEEIHSGLTQSQRNKAIQNFMLGEVQVLVSTDIAARGIDIKGITHIISFDVPNTYDDYVHRAGRTARYDQKGISIILASPKEFNKLHEIESHLKSKIPRIKKVSVSKKRNVDLSRKVSKSRKSKIKDSKNSKNKRYKR